MALTKEQKQAQVAELKDLLQRSKSLVWMEYRGLSVGDVEELRWKMKEKGAEMKVAKKTLFNIAAKEEGMPEVASDAMQGPVAFVFSFEEEVSGAKVAFEFSKEHNVVKLTGGILNNQILSAAEALELAKMLSREQMLGKVIGMFQSPLQSFHSACSSPLKGFAIALSALADKGGVGEAAEVVEEKKEEAPVEEAKEEASSEEVSAAEPETAPQEEKKEEASEPETES